mmetsp:Transcript_21334/g.34296  ORF Transcript_21334/g.34296 Transcript_21334/m.34296 type:complete len:264 (-) Transcript_21334:790-1581(-)
MHCTFRRQVLRRHFGCHRQFIRKHRIRTVRAKHNLLQQFHCGSATVGCGHIFNLGLLGQQTTDEEYRGWIFEVEYLLNEFIQRILGRRMITRHFRIIQHFEQIVGNLFQISDRDIFIAKLQRIMKHVRQRIDRGLLHFRFIIHHLRRPSAQQLWNITSRQHVIEQRIRAEIRTQLFHGSHAIIPRHIAIRQLAHKLDRVNGKRRFLRKHKIIDIERFTRGCRHHHAFHNRHTAEFIAQHINRDRRRLRHGVQFLEQCFHVVLR